MGKPFRALYIYSERNDTAMGVEIAYFCMEWKEMI
jgi:hypothetical protein